MEPTGIEPVTSGLQGARSPDSPQGRRGDRVLEAQAADRREIVVPACYQLGRTLIEHDLVDELRLVVFPVVLGAGERLFGDTSDRKPMRLLNARTIGKSLVHLTYGLAQEA
jgi:dihydrofolate reductase